MRADIEIRHAPRATPRGIKREPAGKAKRIQDSSVSGEGFDSPPVLSLIEKEAGLLTVQDVGFEPQPAFPKDNRPRHHSAPQQLPILQLEFLHRQTCDIAT